MNKYKQIWIWILKTIKTITMFLKSKRQSPITASLYCSKYQQNKSKYFILLSPQGLMWFQMLFNLFLYVFKKSLGRSLFVVRVNDKITVNKFGVLTYEKACWGYNPSSYVHVLSWSILCISNKKTLLHIDMCSLFMYKK